MIVNVIFLLFTTTDRLFNGWMLDQPIFDFIVHQDSKTFCNGLRRVQTFTTWFHVVVVFCFFTSMLGEPYDFHENGKYWWNMCKHIFKIGLWLINKKLSKIIATADVTRATKDRQCCLFSSSLWELIALFVKVKDSLLAILAIKLFQSALSVETCAHTICHRRKLSLAIPSGHGNV